MSALEQPKRREMVFTATSESWQRIDSLMEQQGHQVHSLTIARGFALVQWVLEQQAAGRIVGSLETGEEDFEALVERPELLAPRPRLQAVPVPEPMLSTPERAPAAQDEPVQAQAPAVVDAPASTSSLPPELLAKLVPREKKPPAATPAPRRRAPSRAGETLRAHLVDDANGPIKSFTWVRWKSESEKRPAPILVGDDRPLPGELSLEHLPDLDCMLVERRHATHFMITAHGELLYYGYTPGKGWGCLEECSLRLLPDKSCNVGLFAIFPIVMAVEYLRRLANPSREVASE